MIFIDLLSPVGGGFAAVFTRRPWASGLLKNRQIRTHHHTCLILDIKKLIHSEQQDVTSKCSSENELYNFSLELLQYVGGFSV